ncbi:MAG: endonuclease, partial [Salinivirgaceae bacterium]|nr:endonuclease [Salinivirgaceae bacterium]
MKKTFIFLFLILTSWVLIGQAPAGYYDPAQGLSGEPLRSALHDIIDGHTSISYSALWNAYRNTDKKPNGKVWDIYSECDWTFGSDQCGNYSNICDCYNREHTVPQSWFNSASPMYSDIYHILPTDGKVNGYRSSYPYGECENGTVYGLGKLGTSTTPGYSSTVFEPIDEYKGDIARIYFYMATRYMDVCSGWSGASFSGNNLSVWTQILMINWHTQDPVSQKEIDRNNKIYSDYQHNRNPFVDHPEWVAEIWGEGSNVLDPQNVTAYASSATQISLIWILNNNNDDILLAYNTSNSFGTPQSNNTISGNGTVLLSGQHTTFEHTNLSAQTYYYKIWSKNSDGDFSNGVTTSSTPFLAEPANHVSNFRSTSSNTTTVSLAWSDAVGTPLPSQYLILASTSTITAPTDGNPIYNSDFAQNVNYGIQSVSFANLAPETTYNFAIYPYTNYGSSIDYKTVGAPTITLTTGEVTDAMIIISEIAGRGYNGNFNDEYIEIMNLGDLPANLSGYTLEYYESDLLETVNLT